MTEGEDTLPQTVQDGRPLYTTGWISGAAFVGGPLPAAYLLARNFKALGEDENARRSLYGALAALVAVFGLLALLPHRIADSTWLSGLVNGVWAAGAAGLAEQYQGDAIKAHLEAEGERGSWGRAIAAMVGGLAVTVVMAMVITSVAPPFEGTRYEVPGTGASIYYSGTATLSDAEGLGELLTQIGYFTEEEGVAKLAGDDERLDLWLALEQEGWDDPVLLEEVDALAIALEARTGSPTQVTAMIGDITGLRSQVIRQSDP